MWVYFNCLWLLQNKQAIWFCLFVFCESAEAAGVTPLIIQMKSKLQSAVSVFVSVPAQPLKLLEGFVIVVLRGESSLGARRGTCHNHIKALLHRDEREDDSHFNSGTGKGNDWTL